MMMTDFDHYCTEACARNAHREVASLLPTTWNYRYC